MMAFPSASEIALADIVEFVGYFTIHLKSVYEAFAVVYELTTEFSREERCLVFEGLLQLPRNRYRELHRWRQTKSPDPIEKTTNTLAINSTRCTDPEDLERSKRR